MPTGPDALRYEQRFASGPFPLGVYILHSGVYTLIRYLYTHLNDFGPIRGCSVS